MRASRRSRNQSPEVIVRGPSLFGRIVTFLFAMLLGSVLTIGTIVGAMYGIVGWVTLDRVEEYTGVKLGESFLAEDSVLHGLTVLQMIEEAMKVKDNLSDATVNSLVEEYGIILPPRVLEIVPPELLELELREYAEDGVVNVLLEHMTFGQVLEVYGKGLLPAGLEAKLADRNIGLAVAMDLEALFEEIYVGDILGIEVEKDENGVVNPVLEPGERADFMSHLATVDLGELLGAPSKGAVLQKTLNRIPMSDLLGDSGGDSIFDAIGGKYLGEILHIDNGVSVDADAMIDDLYLGAVLGLEKGEDGIWYDGGKPAIGFYRALADIKVNELATVDFEAAFHDVYVGELMELERGAETSPETPESPARYEWLDGDIAVNALTATLANLQIGTLFEGNVSLDSLGFGDLALHEILGYEYRDGKWYDGETEVAAALGAFMEMTLDELSGGIDTLYIGELMGYTLCKDADGNLVDENGNPVSEPVFLDEDDKVLTGMMAAFAVLTVAELNDSDAIDDAVGGITIADVMGYTYKTVADGAAEDGWYDGDTRVTGIFASLADSKISELDSKVEDVKIGEVLGYTKVGDDWYDGETKVTGIFDALGDSTIETLDDEVKTVKIGEILGYTKVGEDWYDGEEKVTGIFAALGDSTIDNIDENVHTVPLGEILGYTKVGEDWYDGEEKVTGIFAALGDSTIDTLDTDVETVPIGEILGYTKNADDVWCEENGAGELVPVTGIFAALGDCTIKNIDSEVENVTIADVLGYKKNTDDVWCEENGAGELVPVTGIFGALADTAIKDLDEKVKTVAIGEVLGYTKVGDDWYDGETKVTGIFAALGDSTIDNIDENVHTVPLGEILGYTKVDGKWYETDGEGNLVAVTGIFAVLSDSNIDTLKSDAQNVKIGDVLGYTWMDDAHPDADKAFYVGEGWYDGETKVTGIFSALGNSTINNLDTDVQDVKIGDVLGYTKNADGAWCEKNGAGDLVPVTGIFSVLSDSTISTLDSDVGGVYLGSVMGYTTYDTVTGGPVTDATADADIGFRKGAAGSYEYPTGLMATFADMKISDLENESAFGARVRSVKVGEAMGYTYQPHATKTDDPANGLFYGTWYDGTSPVTGVIGTLSNYPVGEVDGAVQNVTLADALGYTYDTADARWEKSDGTEETNPLILTFLDKKVGEMSDVMADLTLADALGYTYDTAEARWEKSDGTPETNPMILALVDKKLSEMSTVLNDLTLADTMGYTYKTVDGDGVAADGWYDGENAVSGFVMILGPDTKLIELDDNLAELDQVPVGKLVDNGILKPEHGSGLSAIFGNEEWKTWSLDVLMDKLIAKAANPFS